MSTLLTSSPEPCRCNQDRRRCAASLGPLPAYLGVTVLACIGYGAVFLILEGKLTILGRMLQGTLLGDTPKLWAR